MCFNIYQLLKGELLLNNNLHDNHRKRVYKRFLNEGLMGFEEHNALEFLLFLSKARGDTNALAHNLINEFGSLSAVLEADIEELLTVKGVGEVTATTLKFIPEMCAYYIENKRDKKAKLDTIQAVSEFFMPKFFGKTNELFFAVALDDKRNLLRSMLVSEGTGNATSVSISKIVAMATRCNATAVILAHNHPRSATLPSSSDIICTQNIYAALNTVNITLLDHLIFYNNEYISFAQTSYMNTIKERFKGR